MSLQIKKATVCPSCWHTYMYKNGGVNQRKPATKQLEWSTKSLLWKQRKKRTSPDVQNVQP